MSIVNARDLVEWSLTAGRWRRGRAKRDAWLTRLARLTPLAAAWCLVELKLWRNVEKDPFFVLVEPVQRFDRGTLYDWSNAYDGNVGFAWRIGA